MPQALNGPQFTVTREALSPLRERPRSSRSAVLVTACCGVFVSFASILVYTFGVFLKPLAGEFHWSRTQVSLAFTLAALTVAVCSPFLGRLLDRFPARRIILPCTVVYALAFGSLAFLTPHLWHLYATFVVLGIVGNGTTQLGYARIVSAWFDRHRGRALAAVMAGSGLGSMVFPPITQFLISHWGWRTAYLSLAALIAVIALPLATIFLYEPSSKSDQRDHAVPGKAESALASIRSLPFLGICLSLLLFSFATNGLYAHWAPLLTDGGAPAWQAALVLSVAGFSALVSKLSTGYFLDRFRAGRVAATLLIFCALGFLLIVSTSTQWLSLASGALVGIGMGAESDAIPYLLTRYFGLARFGELYGYTWCVYAVAGASGPAAMGAVFDHTGSYRVMLLVGLAMVLAASLIFAMLPEYRTSARATTDY
jgi:predicted MFS family arabinose efflux permease